MPEHIGLYSLRLLKFIHRDPQRVIAMDKVEYKDYILSSVYRKDIYPVIFLRTQCLNEDLYHYLSDRGLPEKCIAFIKKADRINASSFAKPDYTEGQKEYLRQQDLLADKLYDEVSRTYADRYQ